ncbi:retrovirus-related pol polyprotein from transposon TNT 1-94 [Tanacetum coccineum]
MKSSIAQKVSNDINSSVPDIISHSLKAQLPGLLSDAFLSVTLLEKEHSSSNTSTINRSVWMHPSYRIRARLRPVEPRGEYFLRPMIRQLTLKSDHEYQNCPLHFDDKIRFANFLPLEMSEFDISLGIEDQLSAKHQLAVKGLSECRASESNIRRIQIKDIVKEVKDYLKTYSSAGMDISWSNPQWPQLRSTQMNDKVVPNNSQVMIKKKKVEDHHKISSISNKTKSVTAWDNSLNVRTLNAKVVCVTYDKCNRGSDFYTIALEESFSPTPICFMEKASQTQAWLWHRRLSHLNFDTINMLSKNDIVNFLPKLNSKGRLHLLHMDLCGPMRVESINGKKYILSIVDDYSRYTWTHLLRSKDKTPEVLIDFSR